jgi:hypothetical protein
LAITNLYGISRQDGLKLAKLLEEEPCLFGRLTALNRTLVEVIPGFVILGCMLHSHIPSESNGVARLKVNDFKKIQGWTVDEHNLEHEEDFTWLQTQLEALRNKATSSVRKQLDLQKARVLAVTHHARSTHGASEPQLENTGVSSAFSN